MASSVIVKKKSRQLRPSRDLRSKKKNGATAAQKAKTAAAKKGKAAAAKKASKKAKSAAPEKEPEAVDAAAQEPEAVDAAVKVGEGVHAAAQEPEAVTSAAKKVKAAAQEPEAVDAAVKVTEAVDAAAQEPEAVTSAAKKVKTAAQEPEAVDAAAQEPEAVDAAAQEPEAVTSAAKKVKAAAAAKKVKGDQRAKIAAQKVKAAAAAKKAKDAQRAKIAAQKAKAAAAAKKVKAAAAAKKVKAAAAAKKAKATQKAKIAAQKAKAAKKAAAQKAKIAAQKAMKKPYSLKSSRLKEGLVNVTKPHRDSATATATAAAATNSALPAAAAVVAPTSVLVISEKALMNYKLGYTMPSLYYNPTTARIEANPQYSRLSSAKLSALQTLTLHGVRQAVPGELTPAQSLLKLQEALLLTLASALASFPSEGVEGSASPLVSLRTREAADSWIPSLTKLLGGGSTELPSGMVATVAHLLSFTGLARDQIMAALTVLQERQTRDTAPLLHASRSAAERQAVTATTARLVELTTAITDVQLGYATLREDAPGSGKLLVQGVTQLLRCVVAAARCSSSSSTPQPTGRVTHYDAVRGHLTLFRDEVTQPWGVDVTPATGNLSLVWQSTIDATPAGRMLHHQLQYSRPCTGLQVTGVEKATLPSEQEGRTRHIQAALRAPVKTLRLSLEPIALPVTRKAREVSCWTLPATATHPTGLTQLVLQRPSLKTSWGVSMHFDAKAGSAAPRFVGVSSLSLRPESADYLHAHAKKLRISRINGHPTELPSATSSPPSTLYPLLATKEAVKALISQSTTLVLEMEPCHQSAAATTTGSATEAASAVETDSATLPPASPLISGLQEPTTHLTTASDTAAAMKDEAEEPKKAVASRSSSKPKKAVASRSSSKPKKAVTSRSSSKPKKAVTSRSSSKPKKAVKGEAPGNEKAVKATGSRSSAEGPSDPAAFMMSDGDLLVPYTPPGEMALKAVASTKAAKEVAAGETSAGKGKHQKAEIASAVEAAVAAVATESSDNGEVTALPSNSNSSDSLTKKASVSLAELVEAQSLVFSNNVKLEKFDGTTAQFVRPSVEQPWNLNVTFQGDAVLLTKLPPLPSVAGAARHPYARYFGLQKGRNTIRARLEEVNGLEVSSLPKGDRSRLLDMIKSSRTLRLLLRKGPR